MTSAQTNNIVTSISIKIKPYVCLKACGAGQLTPALRKDYSISFIATSFTTFPQNQRVHSLFIESDVKQHLILVLAHNATIFRCSAFRPYRFKAGATKLRTTTSYEWPSQVKLMLKVMSTFCALRNCISATGNGARFVDCSTTLTHIEMS